MFESIRRRWAEARADVLLSEYEDALQRIKSAPPSSVSELSLRLAAGYLDIQKRLGPLENTSTEHRRLLAKEIRQTAQEKFHTNLGFGYGLAFLSMYIESTALPGTKAERVRVGTYDLINIALAQQSEASEPASTTIYGPMVQPYADTQRRVLLDLACDIRGARAFSDHVASYPAAMR